MKRQFLEIHFVKNLPKKQVTRCDVKSSFKDDFKTFRNLIDTQVQLVSNVSFRKYIILNSADQYQHYTNGLIPPNESS